jgi:molybdopterin/thiamine biosynthesis adenylyltransferase/nitroreductase
MSSPSGQPADDPRWQSINMFGGPSAFLEEVVSRNKGIIGDQEQAALQGAQILIAGCGSVGGAVVEPLARLGAGTLVLADLDTYDWHNLNRQACSIADIGTPKPTVLARRVATINPMIHVETHNKGITRENVLGLIEDATVIFDGLDAAGESLWIKYLIHKHAAALRKPVVLGADVGGKPTLFVYDYRRDGRPFYGRAKEADFTEGREIKATQAMTGTLSIPADFFPVIRRRVTTGAPWPQVAYTAAGIGAISTRVIVDLLCGHRVRRVVTADLHMLPRSPGARIKQRVSWPLGAVHTLAVTRRAPSDGATADNADPARQEDLQQHTPDLPRKLLATAEAIRYAPSAFNEQPWRIRVLCDDSLQIELDGARLLGAGDHAGLLSDISLGCAVETVHRVAHACFDPMDLRDGEGHLRGGEIVIERERAEGFVSAVGLLRSRRTNRRPYRTEPLSDGLIARLRARVEQHGVDDSIIASQAAEVTRWAQRLASEEAIAEGWRTNDPSQWLRFGRDGGEDGITIAELGVASPRLGWVRSVLPPRWGQATTTGRRLVARQTAAVADSGALMLLPFGSKTANERVKLGRALMDILLTATRYGLSSHVIAVESSLASEHKEPGLLVRLGNPHTPGLPPARRLPLPAIVLGPRIALRSKGKRPIAQREPTS